MSTRPDGADMALDGLVIDALAEALVDSGHAPAGMAGPLPQPSRTHLPSPPTIGELPADAPSSRELPSIAATPERALKGDQATVERLGRAGSRRDPVSALDPLPWGRDSVTYSTATVATGREAGVHWPELVAFRFSDEFPGGPFDPMSASAHAADNAIPAALFPAAAPDFVPPIRAPRRVEQSTGVDREHPSASVPSWLADAPSWLAPGELVAATQAPAATSIPSWLERDVHLDPSAPRPRPAVSPVRDKPPSGDLPDWLGASSDVPPSRSPTARSAREQPRGIRGDFPALDQEVHGRRLVWLDSAATTQKPRAVIDAMSRFYENDNSNVHRGAHDLAARATDAYEAARAKAQRFLGARSAKEIVFTRGTTEAINLVAQAWGRKHLRSGDVVLVTHLEHHSNIVPWIQLCEATGAVLRVVPVDDAGEVKLEAYEAMLEARVKLVSITHVSNALGTIVPVAPMIAMAHRRGARVLIDGAQAVAHVPVDVQCIGADFYAFSGHKIYGPTGIGVLYGREEVLEEMPPWQGGGSMIEDVTFERVRYAPLPARFEAGTPSLGDAVGLGAALDYVDGVGRPQVFAHEQLLMSTLLTALRTVPGLTLVGSPAMRVGAVSFVLEGHTPSAIGQHLNRHGIAVRSGHHCAQPILRRFGHEATVRPSLGIYNDDDDVARLVEALRSLAGTHRRS